MSKIICEICGTSYPETSTQCPICGCVKPMDKSVVIDKEIQAGSTYTYVKGGRFSKRNVKKRNVGLIQFSEKNPQSKEDKEEKEAKTNRILVITIVALLLAIVAVGAFIAINMFGDVLFPPTGTTEEQTQQDPDPVLKIPCVAVNATPEIIVFEAALQEQRLEVSCTPVNTTDAVRYTSDNPEVVKVDSTGKLTAVSQGEATVTIECGTSKAVCHVVCSFNDETVDNKPVTEFKLNSSDFTLSFKGDSWLLYDGVIPVTEVIWSSDDEKIATEKGKVVEVGAGTTKVHAEYDGKKYSCIVRCAFEDEPGVPDDKKLTINKTDVTISVGEVFYLTLKDANGQTMDVSWTSTKPETVDISGNKITGRSATDYSKVYATYDGVEYSCIVRVKQ